MPHNLGPRSALLDAITAGHDQVVSLLIQHGDSCLCEEWILRLLHLGSHLVIYSLGGEAPKDFTKTRQTIQSPDRLYKAPKPGRDYTKTQNIKQNHKY